MGGDWHKDSDNLKAMRVEIKQLHYSLDNRQIIKNNLSNFPWINQNITCSENVQKQLKDFADQNLEVKPKNNPENKNDRPSY